MGTRRIKFELSFEKLSFKFEGDQEIGKHLQDGIQRGLGGLMETQRRVLTHHRIIDATPQSSDGDDPPRKSIRQKRTGSRGPRALIAALRSEGFFDEPKGIADIQAKLRTDGHNLESNNLSGPLKRFTQDRVLTRSENEKGKYEYVKGPNEPKPTNGERQDS